MFLMPDGDGRGVGAMSKNYPKDERVAPAGRAVQPPAGDLVLIANRSSAQCDHKKET